MAAIAFDSPRPWSNTTEKTFPRKFAPVVSGALFNEGDFVFLNSANQLTIATSASALGAPTVVGLADHSSQALFVQSNAESTSQRGLFGTTTAGSALQPFAPGAQGHYIAANNAGQLQPFEISLKEPWGVTFAGSQTCGITVDATSSLWIASTQLTGATIVRALDGPGLGVAGDTGKRVIITFLSTTTQTSA